MAAALVAVEAPGLVVYVCVRTYGTIWWLDTFNGTPRTSRRLMQRL